jgi:hypothetical protein
VTFPKKVWEIDVPLPFPFGSAHIRREAPAPPAPPQQPLAGGDKGRPPKQKKTYDDPVPQMHSRWHIVFAYVLGPLYPLLTRWNPSNIVWAALGLVSLASCVGVVAYRSQILRRVEQSGLGVLPLLTLVSLITLVASTAWARALFVAGRRMQQRELLAALRHPSIVTAVSLVFPGLGLFASGHPHRGAFALWIFGPMAAAAFLLYHAPWIWKLNQSVDAGRVPRTALELAFMLSLVTVIGTFFSWFIQALDGARVVSRATGRASHGQAVALALLIAVLAFPFAFKPARVAQDLDRFAGAFRLEGLRLIPLALELSAAKLDPREPLYTYRAAELYEKLGQKGHAYALREDLRAQWSTYAWTQRTAPKPVAAGMMPHVNVLPPVMGPVNVLPPVMDPVQQPANRPDRERDPEEGELVP